MAPSQVHPQARRLFNQHHQHCERMYRARSLARTLQEIETIVIPKPNKQSYNSLKSFRPIVLLNTLDKLIEKVIGERLQFHIVANDFIYPSQLGGLKFKSTIDADVALTHIIHSG